MNNESNETPIKHEWISGLLLIIMSIVTLVSWYLGVWFFNNDKPVPYWMYRFAVDYSGYFGLIVLILGFITLITQLIIWRKHWIVLLFITVPIIMICMSVFFVAFIFVGTTLGYQTHHDTVQTENHIYHLSSEWKIGVGRASKALYSMWQCNLSQTQCHIIYSERIPPIYPEDEYLATDAVLTIDDATGHIFMMIGDDIVYTHVP